MLLNSIIICWKPKVKLVILSCLPKTDSGVMLGSGHTGGKKDDKTHSLFTGVDNHQIAWSRGLSEPGKNCGLGLQNPGDQRTNTLPLAQGLRGNGYIESFNGKMRDELLNDRSSIPWWKHRSWSRSGGRNTTRSGRTAPCRIILLNRLLTHVESTRTGGIYSRRYWSQLYLVI